MSESQTQTYPCGPTTMLATEYNSTIAGQVYACGQEQVQYSEKKSNSSINSISIKKLVILFLAVMMAVVSASDLDTNNELNDVVSLFST